MIKKTKICKDNYTKYTFSKTLYKILKKIEVEISIKNPEKYKNNERISFFMKDITRDPTDTGNSPHLRYFGFVSQAENGKNGNYICNTKLLKEFLNGDISLPKYIYKRKNTEDYTQNIYSDDYITVNDII